LSESVNKMRLEVGRFYNLSYDPDGTNQSVCDVVGVFQELDLDGNLIFKIEDMDPLIIPPGQIATLTKVHSKRIHSKIKMGKPRGIYPATERVENPRTGQIHEVCIEEAQMLTRSFGYVWMEKPFIEGVINDGT
jgi:hypothetical protein